MVETIALWFGYIILFGSLGLLSLFLWAIFLSLIPGVVKRSFSAINFYYRFLCWHKCKEKVESWLSTDEGRKHYGQIMYDSKCYWNEVNKNEDAIKDMFSSFCWWND